MKHIYVMLNSSLSQTYVGTTELDDIDECIAEHPNADGVNHWDFANEDITWEQLYDKYEFADEKESREMARLIEKKLRHQKFNSMRSLINATVMSGPRGQRKGQFYYS